MDNAEANLRNFPAIRKTEKDVLRSRTTYAYYLARGFSDLAKVEIQITINSIMKKRTVHNVAQSLKKLFWELQVGERRTAFVRWILDSLGKDRLSVYDIRKLDIKLKELIEDEV